MPNCDEIRDFRELLQLQRRGELTRAELVGPEDEEVWYLDVITTDGRRLRLSGDTQNRKKSAVGERRFRTIKVAACAARDLGFGGVAVEIPTVRASLHPDRKYI